MERGSESAGSGSKHKRVESFLCRIFSRVSVYSIAVRAQPPESDNTTTSLADLRISIGPSCFAAYYYY